jgi:heme A synthase
VTDALVWVRLRRADRSCGVPQVVLATFVLGVASILGMPSLPLAVLHNAAAAMLVATLAAGVVRHTAASRAD